MIGFPESFLWGTATSAYQIEGGVAEGGRGQSIWDQFSHAGGNITDGTNGDVACDHFHRYRQDVELMAALGINAYRFSIAWPRIYPRAADPGDATGALNQAGLDFYDALTDALLEHDITPMATLYHWDLPVWLGERGGWMNRDTARYFADYAERMARSLGDRVRLWVTHNEPYICAHGGYERGRHAPGKRDLAMALQVGHHLLLSHGLALPQMRDAAPQPLQLGISLNLFPVHTFGEKAADQDAASRADGYYNRWYLDPLLRGAYPEDLTEAYRELGVLPEVAEYDLATIAAPIDFLGVNYYYRILAGAGSAHNADQPAADRTAYVAPGQPTTSSAHPQLGFATHRGDGPRTGANWEVYPAGLDESLRRLYREYPPGAGGPPAYYITESGAAYADQPDDSGFVDDQERARYHAEHLESAAAAIAAGVPLRGYFAWTLMDNFEWAEGYRYRSGLVRVDFATQQRIPKRSALWYRDVAQQGGLP